MPSLYDDKLAGGVDTEWLAKNPAPNREYGVGERLALGAGLAVPRAIEGLMQSGVGIANFAGLTDHTAEDAWQLDPAVSHLPPGTTTGQSLADLASGLMPLALELPLMGGPVRALTGISGLTARAPTIARALIQGTEFGGLAAGSGDAATTAEQFGEGALGGAISAALPRGLLRTALSTALGFGSKAFFDRDGGHKVVGDITQGDIAGTALAGVTAFVGKPVPKWTKPVVGEIPTRIAQPQGGFINPEAVKPFSPQGPLIDPLGEFARQGGGVRSPIKSAEETARAMQAAWGFDPLNIGQAEGESLQSLQRLAEAKTQEINRAPQSEYARLVGELNSIHDRIDNFAMGDAEASAAFFQQAGVGRLPEMRDPLHELQAVQLTSRTPDTLAIRRLAAEGLRQHGAEAAARFGAPVDLIPQPKTPLLAIARADHPQVQITDLAADQTLPQIYNRQPPYPVQKPSGIWVQGNPMLPGGALEGPIAQPVDPATQSVFNPANKQLVYDAAFAGHNPDLLHQGEMTLQQLQTGWFAQDVLTANKQQTIDLMNWTHGLEAAPTVTGADNLTKLARSPNIPADMLATEIRAMGQAERIALGRELNVDPENTLALAQALKEVHDPSLRPRTPPQNPVSEADMQAMLYGPDNPNLSPRENEILRGMRKADPNRGYTTPETMAALARGGFGGVIGYAEGIREDKSEGEKLLYAAALGGAAAFGPAILRGIHGAVFGGTAEARIPQWGGRSEVQRTTPGAQPPPHDGYNPRLGEIKEMEWKRAAALNDVETLQRLQKEETRKGLIPQLPEYMRREGGGIANPFSGRGGLPEGFQTEIVDHGKFLTLNLRQGKVRVGELNAQVMGDKLQIKNSSVDESVRGKKFGIHLYDKLLDEARARGLTLTSDFVVSQDAQYIYDALEKRGYRVERNPNTHIEDYPDIPGLMKKIVSDDGQPVFKVYPPETGGTANRQPPFNEGGFRSQELSAAMSRAAVGGLVGGAGGSLVDDPDSKTGLAAGMVGGALLAAFGPAAIRMALAEHAAGTKPQLHPVLDQPIAAGAPKFSFAEMLAKARLAVNEPTVMGQAPTLRDRALERFSYWFNQSWGPKFGRVLNQSAGPIAFHTQLMDDAFHKLAFVEADDTMRQTTADFFAQKMTEQEYRQKMSGDTKQKAYADFAIVANNSKNQLKELVAKGVGNNKRAELLRTTDDYLTRSFRLFTDKSYSPSVDSTQKLAQTIFEKNAWVDTETGRAPGLGEIQSRLNQYVQEIKTNGGVYKTEQGKKIDQTAFGHRKSVDPEWRQFLGEITDPIDRIRLTVLKLKPMAEASNFMHQVASGLNLSDEGLRYTFSSSGELEAAKAKVLQSLQTDPANPQLRKQLLELQQYRYVEQDPRNGMLQGQMVHRNVYDVMNEWNTGSKVDSAAGRALLGINQFMKANVTYRNPMGMIRQVLSTPFFLQAGRGLGGMEEAWNVMFKKSDPAMLQELFDNGILNVDSVTKDVLRDVDQLSASALARGSANGPMAFLGRIDHSIAKAGAVGQMLDSKMAEMFKTPDNFNRAAIYLAAKTRFAKETGAALSSPEVINRAVEHTNRYSMNYSLMPKAVVRGRNVPGVNLFLSYASEMGRILKNVGEDLINPNTPGDQRMNAIMTLGTMLALPEAMQKLSESSLSKKDQEDWEKVKAGMPAYLKDRYYVVQGREPNGKFRVYDFSKLLPADQFQQTIRALSEGRMTDVAQNNPVVGFDNNPALNVASSLIMGEDRISGRKFRGPADQVAMVAKEIGGPLTPKEGSTWRHFEQAFSYNSNGTQGITDKRGRTITPSDFWLDTIAQVRASNVDPQVIEGAVRSQYKQDVANVMAYHNDVMKSKDQPQEVKARTAARTKEALAQLQYKLLRQLGINPAAAVTP